MTTVDHERILRLEERIASLIFEATQLCRPARIDGCRQLNESQTPHLKLTDSSPQPRAA